jgi:uncharacterized protein (DUF983 family)
MAFSDPRPSVMILRGLRKRCPRCGAKAQFRRYFKLRERCARCGFKFAREEGFWTGVYLVNYGLTAVLLVIMLFGIIVLYSSSEDASTVPYYVIGATIAIGFPLWFYPRAATTWAALDLLMRPLEPTEEAEAATYAASERDSFRGET